MTTENGSTIPKTEGCPLETYVSPIKYSDGVLTLTIPQDVITLRYKYLSQLSTDLASVKQLSDMLIWQKYDAGLDELDTSAIGAGIHALADRSEQYVLGAICEEYSEAADRSEEHPLSKANHRAVIDDALEDIVSGVLSIDDPVAQAILNSRKIEALGKSLVKMSDHALPNKSALLDNNSEDLLVMAEMIVKLARETNDLIDQPHTWRS